MRCLTPVNSLSAGSTTDVDNSISFLPKSNLSGILYVLFIKQIFNEGSWHAGINHTLLSLIPKMERPETTAHFRPIGLCNVSCKPITKHIVNRHLSTVVASTQNSFVPGRHITSTNIIIAQEVLHYARGKKGKKKADTY